MATRLKAFASHLNTKRADIAALRAAEPSASGRSDTELLSFLLACDCDREKAAAKLRAADSMIASFGKVTIADIAPWLRAPSPDRRIPDGCVVLLEDMNGGVARDTLGRPIMACIGMQHLYLYNDPIPCLYVGVMAGPFPMIGPGVRWVA